MDAIPPKSENRFLHEVVSQIQITLGEKLSEPFLKILCPINSAFRQVSFNGHNFFEYLPIYNPTFKGIYIKNVYFS